MNISEQIETLIDQHRTISWKQLADLFGQDPRTIRKWIQENVPQVKLRRRKRTFTSGEARLIVRTFDDCEQ